MNPTQKIALWVENDQALYWGARLARNSEELQEWFQDLCEEIPGFAIQILLDLLGPVDWDEIYERVNAE